MLVSDYLEWKPDTSLLEAALYYASIDMAVYPCHSIRDGHCSCGKPDCPNPGKHPRVMGGIHKATTNARQIRYWWGSKWPDANIACRPDQSMCVIDLDEGKRIVNGELKIKVGRSQTLPALEAEHGPLLPVVEQRSGGGGRHILCRVPDGARVHGKPADDIEIKSHSGYILLAPSSHISGNRYEWITPPDRMLLDLLPPLPAWGVRGKQRTDGKSSKTRSGHPFEVFRSAVMAIPNSGKYDDRNEWVGMIAAIKHESQGAEDPELYRELAHDWSDTWDGGNDPTVTDDVWDSIHGGGNERTWLSIWREAKEHGWREPNPAEKFDNLDKDLIGPATRSKPTLLSPAECATRPSPGYIIKTLLTPGDLMCLLGMPGTGKSLAAPHMGYMIAQGRPVFGLRTRATKVFYVAVENPTGMEGRIAALRERHGEADNFRLIPDLSDLTGNTDDLRALQAVVREQPCVVIIDTQFMAFPGIDENSAQGMGVVIRSCRSLTKLGAAVVTIHHPTQANSDSPRGHSSFNGDLDVSFKLNRGTDDITRGQLLKNRNGSLDHNIAFAIDVSQTGVDEDGDPVTQALVRELNPISTPHGAKLTERERGALTTLIGMIVLRPQGVPVREWRQACFANASVSAHEDRRRRSEAMTRAIEGLARKRRIYINDDVASLVNSAADKFEDLRSEG